MTDDARKITTEDLIAGIDTTAWEALRQRYEGKFETFGGQRPADKNDRCELNYSKFFDLETFIPYHFRLVRLTGLDKEETPKRVLDIGCGSGIFLHICKTFGHDPMGIEVDSEMYLAMAEVLGVPITVAPVMAMQPQPQEIAGFDWITAIAIKFDRLDWGPQSAEHWKLEDWQFFIEDLATRLNPGGQIMIKPNYAERPSATSAGRFFLDPRIEPYLEKVATRRTETEFFLSKETIL